jgi:hypothetical protein
MAARRGKERFYILLSVISSVMYHRVVVVISDWFIEKYVEGNSCGVFRAVV